MTQSLIAWGERPESGLDRLDPRAKILAFIGAAAVVASAPGRLDGWYGAYFLAVLVLAGWGRLGAAYLVTRCLAATPFVLMAGLLPAISGVLESGELTLDRVLAGGCLLLRAYGVVLLLALLAGSSHFPDLLWGFRKLKAPEALHGVASLMYRYLDLLSEEWQRLTRARESRGGREGSVRLWGTQLGLVFVRSWERAERVHRAMLARGFTGTFPIYHESRFGAGDAAFVGGLWLTFAAVRLMQIQG